jgi:hypothetical protein
MKKFKNLLMFVVAGVFVAVCIINFKIGLADYAKKNSSSMLTLEAMTSGEAGMETGEYSGPCRTVERKERVVRGWNKGCAAGIEQYYPEEIVYRCQGNDGGMCNPGSILVYYNCNGSVERKTDDRSTAYCSSY